MELYDLEDHRTSFYDLIERRYNVQFRKIFTRPQEDLDFIIEHDRILHALVSRCEDYPYYQYYRGLIDVVKRRGNRRLCLRRSKRILLGVKHLFGVFHRYHFVGHATKELMMYGLEYRFGNVCSQLVDCFIKTCSVCTKRELLKVTSEKHQEYFYDRLDVLYDLDRRVLDIKPQCFQEFCASFPIILDSLINERNRYMYKKWAKETFTFVRIDSGFWIKFHGEDSYVVPKEDVFSVISRNHESHHSNAFKETLSKVQQHFSYIPAKVVKLFVESCPFCRTNTAE